MNARSAQLKEFVRKYSKPHSLIALEAQLARDGLLPLLEENGAMPVIVSPNPHHPEAERGEHEKWWNENPDARVTYKKTEQARSNALLLIHLGRVLGDDTNPPRLK